MGKAVISLTTGLEDAEKVTVAFLVAVGAAEAGRPTLMFLTKEAVRLADGRGLGTACEAAHRWLTWRGTPRPAAVPGLPDLLHRRELDERLVPNADARRHRADVGVDRR